MAWQPKVLSIRRVVFTVGEAERRAKIVAINKRFRGEHIPQRYTCSINHGWH